MAVKNCMMCGGKGQVRCSMCHGVGLVDGNTETCPACSSFILNVPSGKLKCESCDGKGFYIEYEPSPTPTTYPSYSGSGDSSKMSVLDWVLAVVGVGFILFFVAYIGELLYNKSQSLAQNNPATILNKEINSTLNGWVGTLVNKDIERHMNYYAHNLMPYNGLKKASISKAKSDIQEMFAKYTTLTIELTNIKIYPEASGTKVKIVCDKKFDFQGKTYFTGAVQQTFWLERFSDAWLIIGEKEENTSNTKSGSYPQPAK